MSGERTLPGLGLTAGWTPGTSGWNVGMDANLRVLSLMVQARALSRVTALPSSPAAGAVYLVPADAPSHANELAAWDNGAWFYLVPKEGTEVYVVDEHARYRFGADGTWAPVASGVGNGGGSSGGGGTGSGGLIPLHPPTAELFDFQAAAAGIVLRKTANARAYSMVRTEITNGDVVAFCGKNVPAGTAWQADAILKGGLPKNGVYLRTGIGLHESATGKSIVWGHDTGGNDSGQGSMLVQYYNALNSFGSTPYSLPRVVLERELWLRIRYDGTNYYFDESLDYGASYQNRASVAKSNFFTADKIGLCMESYNAFNGTADNGQLAIQCHYWSDPDYPAT